MYNISGCGGRLKEPSGVITSPRYPNAMSARRDCYWAIYAPEGRKVKVRFEAINLPRDEILDSCISHVTVSIPFTCFGTGKGLSAIRDW